MWECHWRLYQVCSIYPLEQYRGWQLDKKCFLRRGRWTIISCDLELFNFKLLAVAQFVMCWISCIDDELVTGTKRYIVSSAYLQSRLKGEIGCRSEAVRTYSAGPRAEPWIMLALIGSIGETLPSSFVLCCRPDRLLTNQLWRLSGRVKFASLLTRL